MTDEQRALYLILCAHLGAQTGGPQVGLTDLLSLSTLLGREIGRRELKHLATTPWITLEVDPDWIATDDSFAFQLNAPDGKPRRFEPGSFFWVQSRILGASQQIGPLGIAVYANLCFYADSHTGISFPTLKTISLDVGCAEKTLAGDGSVINKLATLRYIEVKQQWKGPEQKTSSLYRILDP